MPYYVVNVLAKCETESEAAEFLRGADSSPALVRGEEIKYTVEVVRRVVIDSRTLPLPFAVVDQPPPADVGPKPKKGGARAKYGDKPASSPMPCATTT